MESSWKGPRCDATRERNLLRGASSRGVDEDQWKVQRFHGPL